MLDEAKQQTLLELSTPFVTDAMYRLGLPERVAQTPVRPVVPYSRMVGTAVTIRFQREPDPARADLSGYVNVLNSPGGAYAPIVVIKVPKELHNKGIFGGGAPPCSPGRQATSAR